jgi:hypothetical protein
MPFFRLPHVFSFSPPYSFNLSFVYPFCLSYLSLLFKQFYTLDSLHWLLIPKPPSNSKSLDGPLHLSYSLPESSEEVVPMLRRIPFDPINNV